VLAKRKGEENMTRRHLVTLIALGSGLLIPLTAQAGTPLMCHANDIGTAASLPWGDTSRTHHAPVADYPHQRLVKDTLDLLTPRTPVVVRMETLRRATIYARLFEEKGHPRLADELLARLEARALDAEAAGAPDALAWFDAGYLAASVVEFFPGRDSGRNVKESNGYRWVTRALRARGGDPEMEFAAALITRERPGTTSGHWARASAGSKTNPLLSRNLAARLSP
jgi:hypothetical protein